jgi:hypothetical protein
MVPNPPDNIHGAPRQKLQVFRVGGSRLHPITAVKTIAEHQSISVAQIQEFLRRHRDILKKDQIQPGVGKIPDFGLHATSVPVEEDFRLQVATSAENPPAVDIQPESMGVASLVKFSAYVPNAEPDIFLVGKFGEDLWLGLAGFGRGHAEGRLA